MSFIRCRLVGVQDLMEDMPSRSRRDSATQFGINMSEGKSFIKSKSFHGRSSAKTYNIKNEDVSSEYDLFGHHNTYIGTFGSANYVSMGMWRDSLRRIPSIGFFLVKIRGAGPC